ncbi:MULTISPECIES: alpha-isopropylmalate synthase regulatory domain-containing protein [Nocardia]|uniref:Alpha-isopropylmalate synthase regulatory domain-containing protein n=1 Tax=Nocardia aurea TaxID=2144174 RepID=A0ABV3FYX9_9NOCA|nr:MULTISPECIES: alpha-isopropylmalate synthase regulatory domain-containing protein [Nocardia]
MTILTLDTTTFIAAAPKGLRAETTELTSAEFFDRYCVQSGPVRLSDWAGAGHGSECTATLEFDDHLRSVATTGSPVAALTSALYDEGYPVEILQFHQRRTADGTATFVRCEFDGKRGWGAALADDSGESTVRAMISSINRLDTRS